MLFCFISDILDVESDLIPMKNIIAFVLILCAGSVIAQKKDYKTLTAITKTTFDKHLPIIDLIIKPKTEHKIKGVIRIKTSKRTFVLKDDGEFRQYVYEGELSGSDIIVIHELEPNTEEYYLINKQTGKIDTLLERPVFFTDKKDFICLEGMGTDVHQRIQVGRIENGGLVKNRFIGNLPEGTNPGFVYWFNRNTLYIDDNGKKFYKLTF